MTASNSKPDFCHLFMADCKKCGITDDRDSCEFRAKRTKKAELWLEPGEVSQLEAEPTRLFGVPVGRSDNETIKFVEEAPLLTELTRLRESEAQAWRLVEACDATVDGFIEAIAGAKKPDDSPARRDKFMAWCKAQDNARAALVARKAGG